MFTEAIFLLFIVIVAFLYASVGHGGASGYLALMVLFEISPVLMKPSALILNLFVSAISFYQFYRGGHFKWKLLLPFIITSMPFSFWGATMQIDAHLYKVILAACLFIAILRLLGVFGRKMPEQTRAVQLPLALLIGAFIGFISGMIGIGGGILLSPVLLLLNWAKMKETAAVSAIFIFLNSLSGIAGAFSSLDVISSQIFTWALAGVIGGTAGAFYGSSRFNTVALKYILSVVLVFACIKLIIT
jgi:uncharacterized membrane protein YfcA